MEKLCLNKETIKQQLESIAKPGINVAAFKTVSLPSQIEKQTLIYRTDASNDYLKMCFMEDFDEMPNKIIDNGKLTHLII